MDEPCHDRCVVALALALVVIAGCWAGAPRAETPAVDDDDDLFAMPRDRFPLHSEWRGEYRCTQGRTAVTLTLDARPSGALRAVFEFGPHPENPDVPAGAYRLAGRIRSGPEGTFDIALQPRAWIRQPVGYIMVPVKARSSRRWLRLVGRMLHPSCGAIDVRRTDERTD